MSSQGFFHFVFNIVGKALKVFNQRVTRSHFYFYYQKEKSDSNVKINWEGEVSDSGDLNNESSNRFRFERRLGGITGRAWKHIGKGEKEPRMFDLSCKNREDILVGRREI